MLPPSSDPNFPAELKRAREALGLNRTAFAEKVGVHKVMIRRYEEPLARTFARPSESTVVRLNRALGYLPEGNEADANPAPLPKSVVKRALEQATIEELIEVLVARGLQPTLRPLPRS